MAEASGGLLMVIVSDAGADELEVGEEGEGQVKGGTKY